jgi:5-methylcytosine-specific restriction endonuclease McrA
MGWINKEKRLAIYRRDNYTCGYCGRKYSQDRLTLDHVKPRALGGSNKPSNLVTCCDTCNNVKRDRTLGQYCHFIRVMKWPYKPNVIKSRVNRFRRRKLRWA